jgi:hypothetical protein
LFSILASEFKAEIKSPDHLLDKIRNSVISPKPLCEELSFIWEWRDFIKPKLSDRKLENHFFLHSFMIKKESGVAVLRAKKYPQDSGHWLPQEGIKLLKDKVDFAEVGVAETRVEKLCLDGVFHGLYTKYFPQLIGPDKSEVIGSWERLKVVLENLPKKRNNLPKMKLYELPKQMSSLKPVLPSYLEQFQSHETRELVGTKHVEDPEESSFVTEVKENMDVAIFTLQKSTRPWLGRVVSVMPGGKDFLIQWYKRKNKSLVFHASVNNNGTPFTSVMSTDSVMLWNFSDNRSVTSFELSQEWFNRIMKEYCDHDVCYV